MSLTPQGDPRWLKVKEILLRAIELPAPLREELVRSECAGDESLIAEVLELLVEHHESPNVPPPGPAARAFPFDVESEIRPGQRIGEYTIVRFLSRGGMGEVFLAQQGGSLDRFVAIKFLRLDIASQEAVLRFQQECSILAKLNHPNIAKIFGSGTTETRSYFVMEYVPGLPITEFCDQNRLSLHDRLKLFRQVLDGIHHCHTRGWVHRDIKPSNILVTSENGVVIPKVIDLGIAKAIGESRASPNLDSLSGGVVGTLAYMSPEQLRPDGGEIAAPSDVYSLGVVLFELLAGAPPFDPRTLTTAGLAEVFRIICERDPPKPSDVVARFAETDATTITKSRRIDRGSLFTKLRHDLECIPLKAIEKDPRRRYDSAAALQLEIDRYLNGEPIKAAPQTMRYLAGKFAHLHKRKVITAVCVLMLGVVTIISLVVGLRRAQAAEKLAEASRDESQRVFESLRELLADADPNQGGTQNITLVDAIRNVVERMDRRETFDQTPAIEARLRIIIANILVGVEKAHDAKPIAQGALNLVRKEYPKGHELVVDAMNQVGIVYGEQTEHGEAIEVLRQSLTLCETIFRGDHPLHAETMRNLAKQLADVQQLDEAEPLCRSALAMYRRLGDDAEVAQTLNNLAGILSKTTTKDPAKQTSILVEAESSWRESIRLYEKLPRPAAHRLNLARAKSNFSVLLRRTGDLEGARSFAESALKERKRAFGETPRRDTAESLIVLAEVCFASGDFNTAAKHFEEACKTYDRAQFATGPEHPRTHQKLGYTLMKLNRPDEAVPHFETALEWYSRPRNATREVFDDDHANTLATFALCRQQQGQQAEAIALRDQARIKAGKSQSEAAGAARKKCGMISEIDSTSHDKPG